jgi:hypothetical protein
MKTIHFFCAAVFCLFIFSCGHGDAQKKASEINSITGQTPATENTDPDGAYLKATIDEKEWKASKMTSYGAGSDYKLVSGEAKDITISFQIHKPTTGLEREFNENNVADFITDDGFFGGKKGKVTVTKVDDKWIEGNFHFTASSDRSGKTYEVKNGFFRIPNR